MLTNVLLGSSDLAASEVFYDALLVLVGAEQVFKNERSILWKTKDSDVGIAVCLPFDGQPVTQANGSMLGLKANSSQQVDAVYAKALSLGGRCAGKPGERQPGIYAAYFRDLEGHKFGIFYRTDI